MHPPEWVLKKLQELHPQVRLGWIGQDREGSEDELNKGHFALIQLYQVRDSERTYFGDEWSDRGPIYGKPFDRLSRVPRYLADLTSEDVFSGRAIALLQRWMRPMKDRFMESAKEKGAGYQSSIDNLAGEMGEEMYWKSKQTDATRPEPVAKKFITEKDKKRLSGEAATGVADVFTKVPDAQPMM